MKKMIMLVALMVFCAAVQSQEADAGCRLERTKTEIQARLAEAPQAFGSLGQDPVTTARSAIAGVSQSFSGRLQASKLREAVESRCAALRATADLDDHMRSAVTLVEKEGAMIEMRHLEEAKRMAAENVIELRRQLSAQTVTVTQYMEARAQMESVETKSTELLKLLAVSLKKPGDFNLREAIETSRREEGRAARLTAEAQASSGWDVVVQAGVRQPLQGGAANTFGNVSFKWSFGQPDAQRAAKRVEEEVMAYASAKEGGYAQLIAHQRESLSKLVDAETQRRFDILKHVREVKAELETLKSLDTAAAQNVRRSLNLEMKLLESERDGSLERNRGYTKLLNQLG